MSPPHTARPPIGIVAVHEADALALAHRLLAQKHRVLVCSRGAPGGALPRGMERVGTATDIAFECPFVIAVIEDTGELRQLLLGTRDRVGLAAEMQPGSTLIDLGIRPPRETQSFLGMLGMRGVSVVDAAILGSAEAIAAGAAVVMAGGFPEALDAVTDVLAAFGRVERTGPLGSAHTAAALMGYMETARLLAREEALSIGRAFSVSPQMLDRILDGDAATPSATIRYLDRGAALTRALAGEGQAEADIIDLNRAKLARGPGDGA